MKHIKSTDPRKPLFSKLLKEASGGNKVTLMKEDATHVYGSCLKSIGGKKYEKLGQFKVEKPQLKVVT